MIHHTSYNPDPQYLKDLLINAGITQQEACQALLIPKRTWYDWMSDKHPSAHSYAVQVAVEALCEERKKY